MDLVILDLCSDLEPAYEAIYGLPIVGDEKVIIDLRLKYLSLYLDLKESMKYIEYLSI